MKDIKIDAYRPVIHRCFRCGYCKYSSDFYAYNCPIYDKFRNDGAMPGGLLWLTNALWNREIEVTKEYSELIFSCTMCGNCNKKCPYEFHDTISDMILSAREYLIEHNAIPQSVKRYLMNSMMGKSPWGEKGKEELSPLLQKYRYTPDCDWLLYLGDMAYYDAYSLSSVKKWIGLLETAGVSFGLLEEPLDGNDILFLGETELFAACCQEAVDFYLEIGVKRICTFSPHAYHVFQNYYPQYGGHFQVTHYTQLLASLLDEGKLKFPQSAGYKVAYHDPCYLGRWNHDYDSARFLLRESGMLLVELPFSKEDAFCCGGGGGNIYTDCLGGGERGAARRRIREANEMGATVLATACPVCTAMLQDAAREEGTQNEIVVRDLIDLLSESLT